MTEEEFAKVYADAKAIVDTRPAWKQNILEISDKPTRTAPREPVIAPAMRTALVEVRYRDDSGSMAGEG